MFSRLRANLPIMSTFFNSPKEAGTEVPADLNKDTTATTASPTLATHNALSSDTDVLSRERSSKPSSEKESTLVDEPIRNSTAAEDTNKEMTTANEDSNKESIPKSDTEKEATKDEDKSGSDDGAKEPEPEYPTAFRLLLITIALCLCVFCVALVRYLLPFSNMIIIGHGCLQYLEIVCIGQHNHCNCHPQNHRSIQLSRRCRLVWKCLLAHYLLRHPDVWQILYFLLYQMDLPPRSLDLRGRLIGLCCHAKLGRSDLRPCRCWSGCRRLVLRVYLDYHPECPVG